MRGRERFERALSLFFSLLSLSPQAAAVASPSLLSLAAAEASLPNREHAALAVTEETEAKALAHGGANEEEERSRPPRASPLAPPPPPLPAAAEAAAEGAA